MYKAAARALIHRNIRLLNEGRCEPALDQSTLNQRIDHLLAVG